MTREEAKENQDRIAKHFDLAHWFGTKCRKCCGVYPRFMKSDAYGGGCWYECDVCGTRTAELPMPWIAEQAWNNGEVMPGQFSLF